ncbi:MAG: virulence RhuM family protein [Propionibacteriaceae bacterium]|nr:virulence RhuM family protein [Propionibacteriaceae bacterium]
MTIGLARAPDGRFAICSDADGHVSVDVRFGSEPIWLSVDRLSEAFGTSPEDISRHIEDIYAEGEVSREGTCQNFLVVRQEGSQQAAREVTCYNLDVILCVGMRVTSAVATQFRVWARQALRERVPSGGVAS